MDLGSENEVGADFEERMEQALSDRCTLPSGGGEPLFAAWQERRVREEEHRQFRQERKERAEEGKESKEALAWAGAGGASAGAGTDAGAGTGAKAAAWPGAGTRT